MKRSKGIVDILAFSTTIIRSYFLKQFIKIALAPPGELFVELEKKNSFTSEVKPC